jgi:hypothetical protein
LNTSSETDFAAATRGLKWFTGAGEAAAVEIV